MIMRAINSKSVSRIAKSRPKGANFGVIPVISFFSGAGGLDEGFLKAGFFPVMAFDNNAAACRTYQMSFPGVRVVKADLSRAPKHYVLDRLSELPIEVRPVGAIGGPPCQAFSSGNSSKRKNDPRALHPRKYAAILKSLNDKYDLDFFVFENVPGLKHKKSAAYFKSLKRLFESAGFTIFEGELNALSFGLAQVRRRLFLVGFNKKKYGGLEFKFPNGSKAKNKTVRDAIGGLPKAAYFKHGLTSDQIPIHPNHWCMRPKSKKFFNGYLKQGHVKGRPFRVLSWDKPSWTVAYGHREVHVHPNGRRRLSVYEAMLLQGFDPKRQLFGNLSDQLRMVSDAVPPPLAHKLAMAILKVVSNGNKIYVDEGFFRSS
jgi:DNA (cytosine-5)-methyltransferase 1